MFLKKINQLADEAEQLDMEQVKQDSLEINLEDFFRKYPVVTKIMVIVLPAIKIFTGSAVDLLIDIIVMKLRNLLPTDDTKVSADEKQ